MTQNVYLHQFCFYKHPLNPTIIFQTTQNYTVWIKNDCFESRVSPSTFSRKCLKTYEAPWQENTSKASLQHQHHIGSNGLHSHLRGLSRILQDRRFFSPLPQCFLFNLFSSKDGVHHKGLETSVIAFIKMKKQHCAIVQQAQLF